MPRRKPTFYPPSLGAVLVLTFLLACDSRQETTEPGVAFVRGGILVDASPSEVALHKDGEAISVQAAQVAPERFLLKYAWSPHEELELSSSLGRVRVVAPVKPSLEPLLVHPLAGTGGAGATSAVTDVALAFSPDAQLLAIGTLLGRLEVLEVSSGRTLWSRSVAEGMVKQVAFSRDGVTLFAGEQSVDGYLWALSARTGEPLWRYRLADDLLSSPPPPPEDRYAIYFLPGVFALEVLPDGSIVCAGVHSFGDQNGWRNRSKLYLFSKEGELKGGFPESGALEANLLGFKTDAAGRRLLVLSKRTSTREPVEDKAITGVHLFSLPSMKWLGALTFTPLEPYFQEVHLWQAVAMTLEGEAGVVGLGDGRAMFLTLSDTGLTLHLEVALGTPLMVSGIPLVTPVSFAASAAGYLFLATGDSNIPQGTEAGSRTPPAPHPSARTLFACERDGRIRWRYAADFAPAGLWAASEDGPLVLATANARHENRRDQNGILLLQPNASSSQRVIAFYPTEGPVFIQGAGTQEGRIAFAETSALTLDGRERFGTDQVHVVY